MAQPSPHLFPMESIQRSAQMSKVLIPQTPKKSWRGHPCPGTAHFLQCTILEPFLNTTSSTPGEARGLFCPKSVKKEQQRIQKGSLSRDPLSPSPSCQAGGKGDRSSLGFARSIGAPASSSQSCWNSKATGIPTPAPGRAALPQAEEKGEAKLSKTCHVPGELFCLGHPQKWSLPFLLCCCPGNKQGFGSRKSGFATSPGGSTSVTSMTL